MGLWRHIFGIIIINDEEHESENNLYNDSQCGNDNNNNDNDIESQSEKYAELVCYFSFFCFFLLSFFRNFV